MYEDIYELCRNIEKVMELFERFMAENKQLKNRQ